MTTPVSSAISAQGTTISINTGTGGSPTYTPISNVKDFTAFDGSAAELDKTNLASVGKEFAMGLPDYGNVSLTLDWDQTDVGQAALFTNYAARTSVLFQIVLPGTTSKTATFTASVRKITVAGGVDKIVSRSVELRITGAVTWS